MITNKLNNVMKKTNEMISIGYSSYTIGYVVGFTELSLNDQMRLLQSTWAEILTLSLTFRSISCVGKLRFATDFALDERLARECGAFELYQQVVGQSPCNYILLLYENWVTLDIL